VQLTPVLVLPVLLLDMLALALAPPAPVAVLKGVPQPTVSASATTALTTPPDVIGPPPRMIPAGILCRRRGEGGVNPTSTDIASPAIQSPLQAAPNRAGRAVPGCAGAVSVADLPVSVTASPVPVASAPSA
jgi:hypothetical protein